jgi:hypothetical protein
MKFRARAHDASQDVLIVCCSSHLLERDGSFLKARPNIPCFLRQPPKQDKRLLFLFTFSDASKVS